MRSIEARFNIMSRKYPLHSSFIVFGRAVKGQEFGRTAIAKFFRKLVSKDDYDRKDIMRLTKHFCEMTEKFTPIEDTKIKRIKGGAGLKKASKQPMKSI